jgi:O-antigen ligase
MINALTIWDRVMFFALLVLVTFIPYSSAMIQSSVGVILIAWVAKRLIILQSKQNISFVKAFSFSSQGLAWPLIFLAVLIISTILLSPAPALSLKKFFSRFLQQIFLMYITIEVINSSKRLYLIMVMLLWTMLVVNADVVFQIFNGQSFIFSSHMVYERVTGPMRHPNDLGTLLVTVFPIIVALILTRKAWILILFKAQFIKLFTVLCGFLFILTLISLGLTFSRGAWIAFAFTMIVGGLYLKKFWQTTVVIILLFVFFWIFGAYFQNTRTDIFPKDSNQIKQEDVGSFLNSSSRYQYWQTAIDVIKKYPLYGCGYNAYIQTLQKLKMTPVEYPHNSILHITAELGVLGLLGYLWFFILVFIKGLEILRIIVIQQHLYILGLGIFCGLIAWFIHGVLDTPWESLKLSILWWVLIGVLMSLKRVSKTLQISKGV